MPSRPPTPPGRGRSIRVGPAPAQVTTPGHSFATERHPPAPGTFHTSDRRSWYNFEVRMNSGWGAAVRGPSVLAGPGDEPPGGRRDGLPTSGTSAWCRRKSGTGASWFGSPALPAGQQRPVGGFDAGQRAPLRIIDRHPPSTSSTPPGWSTTIRVLVLLPPRPARHRAGGATPAAQRSRAPSDSPRSSSRPGRGGFTGARRHPGRPGEESDAVDVARSDDDRPQKSGRSSATMPTCAHARAVATRPRGVRWISPCWRRNGS